MGARRSSNVTQWRESRGPSVAVRTNQATAAWPQFLALHEALGDAEPACTADPEKWTGCETPRAAAPAIQGCSGCPALAECAAYGQAIDASVGVWGGTYRGRAWTKASSADPTARTSTTTTERTERTA